MASNDPMDITFHPIILPKKITLYEKYEGLFKRKERSENRGKLGKFLIENQQQLLGKNQGIERNYVNPKIMVHKKYLKIISNLVQSNENLKKKTKSSFTKSF